MAVTADINAAIATDETDTLGLDLATVAPIKHRLKQAATLNATSTPVASQTWSDQANLAAGVATIDLTALPGKEGSVVDLTGLKVQAILIKNPSSNSAALRVDTGAASGYNILGAAASEATIQQGGCLLLYSPEGLPDVAAGAKNIDLSSSDTDLTYQIAIVAG